jgi:hypothetical protein
MADIFEEHNCPCLQGKSISQTSSKKEAGGKQIFREMGSVFFLVIRELLPDYMALHLRR